MAVGTQRHQWTRPTVNELYNRDVERSELKAFVNRRWEDAAAAKTAYWADCFQRDWRTTWDASQALLIHARQVCAPFPPVGDSERDFAAHRTLRERLDRAAHAFPRR
jgi:hypothetical protein